MGKTYKYTRTPADVVECNRLDTILNCPTNDMPCNVRPQLSCQGCHNYRNLINLSWLNAKRFLYQLEQGRFVGKGTEALWRPEDIAEALRLQYNIWLAQGRFNVSDRLKKGDLDDSIIKSYSKFFFHDSKFVQGEYSPPKGNLFTLPKNKLYTINVDAIDSNVRKDAQHLWVYDTRDFTNVHSYVKAQSNCWVDALAEFRQAIWRSPEELRHYVPKALYIDGKEAHWVWADKDTNVRIGSKSYFKWLKNGPFSFTQTTDQLPPNHLKLSLSGKWAPLIKLVANQHISMKRAAKIARAMCRHAEEESWIVGGGLTAAIADFNDAKHDLQSIQEKV